jgi:hypothetical protein
VKLYMYDSFLVALINNKIFRGSLVMKNSSLPLKKKRIIFSPILVRNHVGCC